jgi:hypothetical protein
MQQWEDSHNFKPPWKQEGRLDGDLQVFQVWNRLLRGLLARRIECAGVVDFGDLMITEA